MTKNIVIITDMTVKGSGYKNIGVAIGTGLSEAGHTVKILGLEYKGEEHFFPFSVIPCANMQLAHAMINNLYVTDKFDILIVAMDVPIQKAFLRMWEQVKTNLQAHSEYWGIFPIESDPVSGSHAFELMKMDKRFVISEFGVQELSKSGVSSIHLPIGVDTESWKIPTKEERKMLRDAFGIVDNEFVILTVADNQERKFLSRTAQIIHHFKENNPDKLVRWVLVTRIHSLIGWNISDLKIEYGLENTLDFDRGISFQELWGLYAMSDCFLLTSKAEGLGIPVLEAMSVGIPVAATNCTGMKESMEKGGGFPIDYETYNYRWIDPFGNQTRYFADVESGANQLRNIEEGNGVKEQTTMARGYVETLSWKKTVETLLREIK